MRKSILDVLSVDQSNIFKLDAFKQMLYRKSFRVDDGWHGLAVGNSQYCLEDVLVEWLLVLAPVVDVVTEELVTSSSLNEPNAPVKWLCSASSVEASSSHSIA
ncbi:unnamed protein product [Toxocara canis]|uniref:Pecanex-like protein n=1 Tax=Toxocara canis TaxID=6265 RepID=A0A183V0P9_TOXCA|nr:unnamed protein product [Toxocara canis]